MNDPKLKLAMARLLPEKIRIFDTPLGGTYFEWIDKTDTCGCRVIETEWLYVMAMVEEQLLNAYEYSGKLKEVMVSDGWVFGKTSNYYIWHAAFNQRATAMCHILKIEV